MEMKAGGPRRLQGKVAIEADVTEGIRLSSPVNRLEQRSARLQEKNTSFNTKEKWNGNRVEAARW